MKKARHAGTGSGKPAAGAQKKTGRNRTFQFVIKEGVHRRIKQRARQVNISMGYFIENLLSSLEYRLQNVIKAIEAGGLHVSDEDVKEIMEAIWFADAMGKGPAFYKKTASRIRKNISTRNDDGDQWQPSIILPKNRKGK
jgi:hypothetical protein